MQQAFSTVPAECFAAIGPAIGQCCYEVDEAVVAKLRADFVDWEQLLLPQGDRWRLDLWLANRLLLRGMGIPDNNIAVSNVCTACNHELFFSYRSAGEITGRIGAVISLA
jgi:copper oxidase (laccase) domain-containing protein